MKKFAIIALLCLTTIAAQAEPWKHQGKVWTTNKVQVTVPATLKPVIDSDGSLTFEKDSLYVSVTALDSNYSVGDFEEEYLDDLKPDYKNIKLGKTTTKKQGDISIELRSGSCTEDGMQMECTLAVYTRGNRSVGVITVKPVGDKESTNLSSQLLQSLQISGENAKTKRKAIG